MTNPIPPATNEIIWGSISFVVILAVLWKFLLPAVQKGLKNREERIRSSLEHAEEAKSEADKLLDEYREKLAEARTEAGTIIEEARRTAESMRRDLMAKADQEAEEQRVRMRDQIDQERAAAVDAVRREAAQFSVELAERIVKQSIDRDAQARLIEEYIRGLEAMSQRGCAFDR